MRCAKMSGRHKRAMTRKKRTDKELEEASNHLHYEFFMLNSVARALASGIAAQGWLGNALLESFVIHFRALHGFFYPPNTAKKDDVIADDYFDDDAWQKLRPELSEGIIRAKKRADKEVAHLTYARLDVTPALKPWVFIEIANEMNKVMDAFLNNVTGNRLGARWKEQ